MHGVTPPLAAALLAALLAAACTAAPTPEGRAEIARGTALPPPGLPGR